MSRMKGRARYVDLIERRYFGSVAAANLQGVRDCFAENAEVLIRHGDAHERRYSPTPGPGQEPLLSFFEHLCGNYDCWFGHFRHTIDEAEQRAASRFTVRLSPKPGGLYADHPTQELLNANFFEFAGDRITFMLIYYANVGAASDIPTGYPTSE